MEKLRICAVVVTYNRLELLKRCIGCLISQSYTLSDIYVVNNGSTDGTKDWLSEQEGLIVITQGNVGGSGGFYRGIKEAFEREYDWYWCMDDDVYPAGDCLEKLVINIAPSLGILCPKRVMAGEIFVGEAKSLNMTNPFKDLHNWLSVEDVKNDDIIEIEGMTFEGPLIKHEVVNAIGYPNRDLFISYDDTDYSYRAFLKGYKIVLVSGAVLNKEKIFTNFSQKEIAIKNKWKLWYKIRNQSYFCHHYGRNFFMKHFGTLGFVIRMTYAILFNIICNTKKYKFKELILPITSFIDGQREKLGKIN